MKPTIELTTSIRQLVDVHFSVLRRPVRKNLCRLSVAFLKLATSVRFGYGGLHLTSIARCLPQATRFKSSYKWLSRFLKCKYFDPSSLAQCMLALLLGHKPPAFTMVLIDQTTIDGVEVINAAVPFEGRAVPVTWVDFEYPWKTTRPASQNVVEKLFLTWLADAAPADTRLLLVLDRGYARVALIQELNRAKQAFLIRGTSKVMLQATVRGRRRSLSVGRLPHRTGVPIRYRHALYHSSQKEPVDVIVYRGPGFKEPWFLIVPPDSEAWLPTEQVVSLYRQRMQIEHCFRDWKSHLGLRGLHLQVQKPERLLRLLMAFTLAYLFTLLLGQDPLAQQARAFFEAQRRHPRHGTCRVLSVLSMALYMMADPQWQARAWNRLLKILAALARHRGVRLPPLPP